MDRFLLIKMIIADFPTKFTPVHPEIISKLKCLWQNNV